MLERRAARATKLVTWLAAIIALLLAVLITRLVPADDPRELVVRDAEGKPRIRSDLYGRDAVLEFLDEEGHVRAWIGYTGGTAGVGLTDEVERARDEPQVLLSSQNRGLVLRDEGAQLQATIGPSHVPFIGLRDATGDQAWLMRADAAYGLHEYRKRAPPPPAEP